MTTPAIIEETEDNRIEVDGTLVTIRWKKETTPAAIARLRTEPRRVATALKQKTLLLQIVAPAAKTVDEAMKLLRQ